MKRVKLCCILDENQYFNPWLDCWAAMRGRKIIRRLCERDTKIHFYEAAVNLSYLARLYQLPQHAQTAKNRLRTLSRGRDSKDQLLAQWSDPDNPYKLSQCSALLPKH